MVPSHKRLRDFESMMSDKVRVQVQAFYECKVDGGEDVEPWGDIIEIYLGKFGQVTSQE